MGKIFKTELTEEKIIEILMNDFQKSSKYKIPNLYIFNWESDYLSYTESGYCYEIEVKISKADFKHDFTKKSKHKILQNDKKKNKPNYFYYAVPENLITEDEIPSYAGLIYVRGRYCKIIKKAPRLHDEKLSEEKLKLTSKFYYNWLSQRENNKKLKKIIKEIEERAESS